MTAASMLALLGGPESGKTTYLGALVDALQSESLPGLKLGALPADARAYESLTEPLLDGRYSQRTKKDERHLLELPLRAVRDGKVEDISLTVGDYAGEEVEQLFQNRTGGFSPEWRARAEARGLLLFLRPDALTPLPRLHPRASLHDSERWQALQGAPVEGEPARSSRPPEATPLRPEHVFGPGILDEPAGPLPARPNDRVRVPTVLAIIELLQFLRHVRGLAPGERLPPGEMRVALLATAWDAVDRSWHERGPRSFLVEQAPLLDDFLWSNFHEDDIACFGLSSTGGDLRDDRYRERYLEEMRGFVEWADVTGKVQLSRNIALPIAWLLSGDRALGEGVEGDQS
ncbi:MAG TPA: hypothetical protein VE093_49745 [Polyangiaceae bacterium]|nr:hypothetical protein [Polyangiaceae bacterium]